MGSPIVALVDHCGLMLEDDRPPGDQSTNHEGDQPETMSTDHETDYPPTRGAGLTIAQAAIQLGISENAVRQRIKRRTIEAAKVDGVWSITLADQSDHQTGHEATTGRDYQSDHERRPAGDQVTDQPPSANVIVSAAARSQVALFHEITAPLVDRIEAQAETIGKLTQERDQLRTELEALRASATEADRGPVQPQRRHDAPVAVETDQDPRRGFWERLRGLLGGP